MSRTSHFVTFICPSYGQFELRSADAVPMQYEIPGGHTVTRLVPTKGITMKFEYGRATYDANNPEHREIIDLARQLIASGDQRVLDARLEELDGSISPPSQNWTVVDNATKLMGLQAGFVNPAHALEFEQSRTEIDQEVVDLILDFMDAPVAVDDSDDDLSASV